MKLIIDATTGCETKDEPSGTAGFMSWSRLCRLMATYGEVTDFEILKALRIDERGITFYVTTKK